VVDGSLLRVGIMRKETNSGSVLDSGNKRSGNRTARTAETRSVLEEGTAGVGGIVSSVEERHLEAQEEAEAGAAAGVLK